MMRPPIALIVPPSPGTAVQGVRSAPEVERYDEFAAEIRRHTASEVHVVEGWLQPHTKEHRDAGARISIGEADRPTEGGLSRPHPLRGPNGNPGRRPAMLRLQIPE